MTNLNEKRKFEPILKHIEPILKNRFIVELSKEFGIESYLIQKVSRPTLTYHSRSNYTWGNLEIEIIDTYAHTPSQGVLKMVEFCKTKKAKFAKKEIVDPKKMVLFNFDIKVVDPTGVATETWTIHVKELVSVEFGENNYESSDIKMIKIVVEPVYCTLKSN